jgi:hypothetical protein
MEGLRTLMCTLIVAASFALSLVTDREQNLYDMLSRRLVVKDATVSAQERLQGFTAELAAMMRTLNPLQLGKKCRALAGDGEGIVTILLVFWTYLSAAAGTVLVVFASLIGLAMCEVENGIVAQSHQQLDLAAKHFKEALKLAPGVAVVYQDYYAFNDNLDLAKQEAACIRLFAIRGNAQDFLARARLRAKEQQYKPAKRDYMMALSGHSGQLNAHETEVAATELSMLQLEEEGAAIPDPQAKPMHTGPFETPPE